MYYLTEGWKGNMKAFIYSFILDVTYLRYTAKQFQVFRYNQIGFKSHFNLLF